eukprot:TRINITY_DN6088_c0_g1_i1.p1 TRINITY_DN6088_c0_g1~~TRINITY_DN6088_c0_g1_i1.p1  ORF type:complete len:138 (+),score=12.11 TRINITY_DN6088_c0_g1_i1:229-642(+)
MTEELSIDANENRRQSFKASRSLSTRKAEVESIREKFPSKVPVIVERYRKEESLPEIDKFKFLVPRDLTLSQLSHIIRVRLRVRQSQAFFLFVSGGDIPALSATLLQLHRKYRDTDGFLYLTYSSQETFGGLPDSAV